MSQRDKAIRRTALLKAWLPITAQITENVVDTNIQAATVNNAVTNNRGEM